MRTDKNSMCSVGSTPAHIHTMQIRRVPELYMDITEQKNCTYCTYTRFEHTKTLRMLFVIVVQNIITVELWAPSHKIKYAQAIERYEKGKKKIYNVIV